MPAIPFQFISSDGPLIAVRQWLPEKRPPGRSLRASVMIAHGAAEHGGRYDRVARLLTEAGYAVYASDHRGHGQTASSLDEAGNAGIDGFNGILRDLKQLAEIIREKHSATPLFLFGHSMGSALSQRFIQLHGDVLAGVILSGSPGLRPNLEHAATSTAQAAEGAAADHASALFRQAFASYNQGFEPIDTGFEWLSRDMAEVRKYIDDPWCGFPLTNRLVAQMSECALESAQLENIRRIPKSLPILLLSGTHDRVGGNGSYVEKLAALYRDVGLTDVTLKMYPQGRHEMLNETNRDEVHRDLLDWLQRR